MDSGTDSDANPSTGETKPFTFALDSNGTGDIDAGIKRGVIGNQVWVDTNQDGIQDATEKGLGNVVVNLYQVGDGETLMQTVSTDLQGNYLFAPLPAGDYVVEFILPPDYTFSPKNAGGGSAIDSDADPDTGRTDVITMSLAAGQNSTQLDWDAGMIGAEPPENIPPIILPPDPGEPVNCPCDNVSSDSSSALNSVSGALMILMTLMLGLFFVRREELNKTER